MDGFSLFNLRDAFQFRVRMLCYVILRLGRLVISATPSGVGINLPLSRGRKATPWLPYVTLRVRILKKWSFFDIGPTARIERGGLAVLFEDWEESNDIGAGDELFSGLDQIETKLCPVAAGDIVAWGAHRDEVSALLDLECRNFELDSEWGDGSSGYDIKSLSLFDILGPDVFDGEIVSSMAVEEAKHLAVGVEGGHFKVRKSGRNWPTWNSRSGADIEDGCSGV